MSWSRGQLKVDLSRIQDLKKQLVEIGFKPSEIDYLIKMHAQFKNINNLDERTITQIEDALISQLDISKKCIRLLQKESCSG
ncbi:MAG: hypothetical protein ACYC2T_12120 [Bacillota bacterium]